MSLEETFAKVVGRHASDEERQRLYRLRDALGLRDNGAFWSIVMALEYYDSFFRRYPTELAQCTLRCIEDARVTTGPLGSHFHQHHRGPGTRPQMFRIVRSRTLINVLDGGRRRLWHRPTSRYRPIADNPPSASPGRSACIPELPPSGEQTGRKQAASRSHVSTPAGGSLGTGDTADSGTLGRRRRHARAAFAAAAAREAAQVQRALSEKVAETSVAIARRLAERPVGIHRVTMLVAAVVAFGALCVSAGYNLAAPVKPFWVTSAETLTPLERAAAVVLAAPAGWMVFALLLPAAVYGARVGWATASGAGERRDQIVGWGLVGACVFASAACAVMLAKLI